MLALLFEYSLNLIYKKNWKIKNNYFLRFDFEKIISGIS